MKTSNKLLMIALLMFLISLGVYNSAIKAEYLTGSYREKFKDYEALDFKDFEEIEIKTAKDIALTVKQGNTKVQVFNNAKKQLKFTQTGKRLIIDMTNANIAYYNSVVITCPKITLITTPVLVGDVKVVEGPKNNRKERNAYQSIEILGFKEDSLRLELNNTCYMTMKQSTITLLNVVAGAARDASAVINIEKGNVVKKADFQINERSSLQLNDVYIPELSYHFSDKATVSFSGAAIKNLNKR